MQPLVLYSTSMTLCHVLSSGQSYSCQYPILNSKLLSLRILRDLILSPKGLDQTIFAKQVKKEQFTFIQNAVESKIQNEEFIAYAQAPQNRLLKRLKKLIRKTIGLDIKRIKKHLIDTSSL